MKTATLFSRVSDNIFQYFCRVKNLVKVYCDILIIWSGRSILLIWPGNFLLHFHHFLSKLRSPNNNVNTAGPTQPYWLLSPRDSGNIVTRGLIPSLSLGHKSQYALVGLAVLYQYWFYDIFPNLNNVSSIND